MEAVNDILTRGVEEIIDKTSLEKKLTSGKKLIIKLGIDPTSPNLHLGHAVVLHKLRQFQDAGHQAVLVIGDFTALVGDPSGRDTQRPILTEKDIQNNWADYQKQAAKILDMDKVQVVHNSTWFKKIGVAGLFDLMSKATINQLIERKDFKDRLTNDNSLTFLETLYPLLQGYDSKELKADVELGGTDQLFNLLMGRQIQKRFNQNQQDILMTPLLVGLDGKDKMSKSAGNFIGLTEDPSAMFGKVMKVPDAIIQNYFELCTRLNTDQISKIMQEGPYIAKKKLALEIVTLYHSTQDASAAQKDFESVFSRKEMPSSIPTVPVDGQPQSYLSLASIAFGTSLSEMRRLIEQHALEDNGKIILDPKEEVTPTNDQILKLGKHRFAKLEVNNVK